MKRIYILALIPLLLMFTVTASAKEYSFSFDTESESPGQSEMDSFIDKLPDDVKEKLASTDADNADGITDKYTVEYFWNAILDSLGKAIAPAVKILSAFIGIVILSSVFRTLAASLNAGEISPIFNICCCLCTALAIYTIQNSVFTVVEGLMSVLSNTMLLMVPVMEAIYISGGNASLTAVSSTGINIMITFSESIYSDILVPAVNVSFLLAAVSSVTGNKGIVFMSKTLRGLVTGILILIMTLMTFVLALQSGAATAADSFGAKAVRFALGSYIPIIGGAVSDSFSMLKSSLTLIKELAGVTGIVVIILLFLSPFASLLLTRLSLSAASAVSGMLGCDSEKELFSEIGSTFTVLIAITLAAAIMYIFAISLFCRSAVAIG